jgi:hypothetical protein
MQVWRGSLSIFDQELHPRQPRQLLVVPDRAVPVPDSLASGAVVDLGQWRTTGFQQGAALSPSMRQVAAYITALPPSSRRWTGWRAARAPSRSPGCFTG